MPLHEYERVAAELRTDILADRYPVGTRLPAMTELMTRFAVSQITVRKAIGELQKQGLVYTGYLDGLRGVIVRSRGRVPHYPTDSLRALRSDFTPSKRDSFTTSVIKAGREPGKKFTMKIAAPPADIAALLGVDPGALVVQRTIYQLLDGEPWSRETSYFPTDLAAETGVDSSSDIAEGTMRRLRDRGVIEAAWTDVITDETASPEDAVDLSIAVGSPLLVQTRIAATEDRITRVVRTVRLGGRSELLFEYGPDNALALIQQAHKRAHSRPQENT
ncbi:GntR family transcriptional regulator [Kutzneria viridogrisea]|uniref:GntR family transcriptional regulator n=1 Tax=Kutzneria viridogrisea TaxID=47990 RepID=A0ABR6BZ10_9PSEU|nr:GntR family transcriptional regulator [Kutzneria viridogrisea]